MLYSALIEEKLNRDKMILTDDKNGYTYRQLHAKAMGLLKYMRDRGIAQGDRVLIRNHNDVGTVEAILACLAGGFIFVLVSSKCGPEETRYIEEDCSAVLFLDLQTEDCLKKEGGRYGNIGREKISESAEACIIYTSGTEGIKKGILVCQKQIIFCCNAILARLKYKESDRVLCGLPLEFDYGLYQIFLSFISGAKVYLVEGNLIQAIPGYLNKWNITIYPAIPSVVNLLLKLKFLRERELPNLRYITFTGEYLPVEQISEIKRVLPSVKIIPMYGITECKRISIMPEDREDKIMGGSCGLPLDGIKVYLEGKDPETGIGELVVEGSNVMEGYWNREAGGFGVNQETGGRTFCTGDLLAMDEEGFLYFHGRRNGFIKVRGHRFSEIEIESLVSVAEGVLECAVIGMQSEFYGEKIAICVYAAEETAKISVRQIMEENPIYRNSYEVYLFERPLPRNGNGKIDKQRLGKMIYDGRNDFFRK